MAREVFMSGLGELYRPRREPMCFDGSNGRMPGGGSPPMSSSNTGAPKQAVVQTPVKTENCCTASSLGAHVPDVIPLQGNLLDDEFRTDDFRINHFKVTECSNLEPHDWTLCAFAHVGEKARRRGTAVYKYVATACPDFRKGTCKRGDACPFAHGVFESWLHPGRYRTQLCKDGLDCDRPVCFFAHSIKELRTPTLPASLANSPDGAAFAAFFGGPSLGSLKAPSLQASVHPPQPQQPAPPSRQQALAEATRQQQQAMQLLQQQQAALKQGQDALRQEQLNLQAAAMRLQQQYAALAQQQQGLVQQQGQQPSSPMAASSCESEGAAAHLQSSFSGSDDELAFSPEQLRRAVSEAEASHANAALHASAPLNSAVLSAWLAARSAAQGVPPRPALQQMATELDCLPKNGRLTAPAPSYQSHAQWAADCQPMAPPSMGLQLQYSAGLALPHHSPAPTSLAFMAGYAHGSAPQSQAPAATEEDILPLSVPPVLAAIWDPPAASWGDMQEPLKPLQANQEPASQNRGVPLSVQRQLSAC